jgi:hypothetical protein
MAGGGIVAFEEGGEVPGFAEGVYVAPTNYDPVGAYSEMRQYYTDEELRKKYNPQALPMMGGSSLLDRLKEIQVKPYTTMEKIKISREFIIPEMIESIGLKGEQWTQLTDEIIEYIIENYTNEAGVRDIKRYIEKIFLTLNLDKIYQRDEFKNGPLKEVTKEIINNILEKPNNEITKIHNKPDIGIINGLYATNNGDGGIIPIQIFNNLYSIIQSCIIYVY